MSCVYTDLAPKIDLGYLFTDESLKSVNISKRQKKDLRASVMIVTETVS